MQAEIWSKNICPYCTRAKRLLNQLNIPYVEYVLGVTPDQLQGEQKLGDRNVLLARMPTAKTVPQIWINDVYVGGCEDLYAAHASGQLAQIMSGDHTTS